MATRLVAVEADFDRIACLVADEPDRPDRYESFLLRQLPTPCEQVLEVGCGAGRLARAIAGLGAKIIGLDSSPEMIRLARERSRDDARIEFDCRDFLAVASDSTLYDCVVSVATLHHLPTAATLKRMASMVRPGGVLLIHDVRSPSGIRDWLLSALAAAFNGDGAWWVRHRLREKRALRDAWRDHGRGERYLTMAEVRALCSTTLPGARNYWHPLWRYTIVWTKSEAPA